MLGGTAANAYGAESKLLPTLIDGIALKQMELSTWRTDAGDFDVLADLPDRQGRHLRYEALAPRQHRPRMGGFRDDPGWPLVAALEVFDEEAQAASPAAIFSQRVVDSRPPPRGVDTPAEAVAVCLDETGEVTIARAVDLLGTAEEEAREALRSLVWEDPTNGELVPATAYLSGDVRTKLEQAQAAACSDKRWRPNIDALAAVLPRQLEPREISSQLGAPWIPPEDIEAFGAQVLDVGLEVERLATLGQWAVALRSGRRSSVSLPPCRGREGVVGAGPARQLYLLLSARLAGLSWC